MAATREATRPSGVRIWLMAARVRTLPAAIAPPRATPAAVASSPLPPAQPSTADRLADLARLRDDGILTEDEFSAAKRRLLGL